MDMYDKYVGQIFDRRYRIVRKIGIGGMAVVFEAVDTVMKRTVAVKMLKEEIAGDAQAVKRFINESKAVSMLSHPNIVSIYDVSVKDELKYIVMERVDGITLKNYMNQRGPLPPKEVMNYTAQILRALEHAHSKGIIHRDIKPQNIMLLKNGRIKVTDFGIAKLPNAETVTMTDKAIGTVYYISPEQASGKPIDPRSDIYSLGVVMYEMSTGKLPFVADSPVSVALKQVSDKPRPPRELLPSITPGVEAMILTAMEKDPARRFQNASGMLHYVLRLREDPSYNFKMSTTQTSMPAVKGRGKKKSGKKKRVRQSRSMFPIISGVMSAFLIVIIITAINMVVYVSNQSKANAAKTVDIPNYVGQIYNDEFIAAITKEGYFKLEVTAEYNDEYEAGYIISQSPAEGERRKVKKDEMYATIKLTVNRAAESFVLKDYSILDKRDASKELKALGLTVLDGTEYGEYDSNIISGHVIRTDPPAGSTVKRGDTVKVYYSLGPDVQLVKVPSFIGMTETAAIFELNEIGITYGKITYEHTDLYKKGEIIEQSKAEGTMVPMGVTEIDFVVSLGPEEDE